MSVVERFASIDRFSRSKIVQSRASRSWRCKPWSRKPRNIQQRSDWRLISELAFECGEQFALKIG